MLKFSEFSNNVHVNEGSLDDKKNNIEQNVDKNKKDEVKVENIDLVPHSIGQEDAKQIVEKYYKLTKELRDAKAEFNSKYAELLKDGPTDGQTWSKFYNNIADKVFALKKVAHDDTQGKEKQAANMLDKMKVDLGITVIDAIAKEAEDEKESEVKIVSAFAEKYGI